MSKKAKTKRAASLVIHAPGKMSKRGRRAIAKWLRHHADCLIKYGDEYTEWRFTGSYRYKAV